MIIALFINLVGIYLFLIETSKSRRNTVIICYVVTLSVIIYGQLNLNGFLLLDFNLTDPELYYKYTKGKTIEEVLLHAFSSTSVAYYLFNWEVGLLTDSATVHGLIIKVINLGVYYAAYLLICRRFYRNDFSYLELLFLIHPYVYMMAIRNIRDFYVFFGCAMLITSLGGNLKSQILKSPISYIIFVLYRPLMAIIAIFSHLLLIFGKLNIFKKAAVSSLLISLLVFFNSISLFIYQFVGMRFANTYAVYFGYADKHYISMVRLFKELSLSPNDLLSFIIVLASAFFRFILTPVLPNYVFHYFNTVKDGVYEIYTNFDFILITSGSLFNILIVIPLVLCTFNMNFRTKYIYVFCFGFLLVYILAHIGMTDIRIRMLFWFLLIVTININKGRASKFKLYTSLSLTILFLLVLPFALSFAGFLI